MKARALYWFEYEGQLSLDDGTVLLLKELLQALDAETYGRFIRLSDGAFLELTAQFQKQLTVLRAVSDGQRLNPLAAQVLSDLVSEASAVAFMKLKAQVRIALSGTPIENHLGELWSIFSSKDCSETYYRGRYFAPISGWQHFSSCA